MDFLHCEEPFNWNMCVILCMFSAQRTRTALDKRTINQISARSFNSQGSENSSFNSLYKSSSSTRGCTNVLSKSTSRSLWLCISSNAHKSRLRSACLCIWICVRTWTEFTCAAKGLQVKISTPQRPKNAIYHADFWGLPALPTTSLPQTHQYITFWDAQGRYCREYCGKDG